METKLNAHKLLYQAPGEVDFHTQLAVPPEQIEKLRNARNMARKAIEDGFAVWWEKILPHKLIPLGRSNVTDYSMITLSPKFHRQGSYSYATLNSPAHVPPQQIDFDDGVFLPMTFIKGMENLSGSPLITSDGYFALVGTLLRPLCDKQGWALDEERSSCVRIQIDSTSHLDIALYAIPDDQFKVMVQNAMDMHPSLQKKMQDNRLKLFDEIYNQLDDKLVMLAKRKTGWMASDPRSIEKWFGRAIATHGEQLRRVCRYLKAWRDEKWPEKSKLTSITLMACAVDAYDKLRGTFTSNRDDAALLMVAQQMRASLRDKVENPVIDGLYLNDDWTPEDYLEYGKAAEDLISNLSASFAVNRLPETAVTNMRNALGSRIPRDPSLVSVANSEILIKEHKPAIVPFPQVHRSQSG